MASGVHWNKPLISKLLTISGGVLLVILVVRLSSSSPVHEELPRAAEPSGHRTLLQQKPEELAQRQKNEEPVDSQLTLLRTKQGRLVGQRAAISRRMNEVMQEFSKMSCALAEKVKAGEDVPREYVGRKFSSTGAWCYNESKWETGLHLTDSGLVKGLTQLYSGKRVVSFGDGPGHYKRDLMNTGALIDYEAFDGAPYCQETSQGRVKYLDLTIPQYGLPLYDWAMSLEVAEHIPPRHEGTYLDNLARHAKEGIVISWGVPGQIGLGHVNSRPLEYVVRAMQDLGFDHDRATSKQLQEGCVMWHFRGKVQNHEEGNIQVFRRNPLKVADPDEA